MYTLHSEIYTFYDKHVRLGQEIQGELADYRDKNMQRIERGLEKLGYKLPIRVCDQGGYAMSTMVQHPDYDYDIDRALIFAAEDLPASSRKARERVLAAIKEAGGNFKQEPEARTNAVTVWYADGHHMDFAIYRASYDTLGNEIIEHAGAEWCRRNPMDITKWFANEVATKSPSTDYGATVKTGQMRRIVQLLKMFAKSRLSWSLSGGLLISVLVAECYSPDMHSDDTALYNTISAIQFRLKYNTEILNPVDRSLKLTYKGEYVNQVIQFREKLEQALEWLQQLCSFDCADLSAYKAWNNVFQHDYWSELINGIELQKAVKSLYVMPTGELRTDKPTDRAVQSPPHRFYGD